MYFKENVEKKMKNMWFFPEIIFSDFLSLALDHSWSLQSQWRGTKPFTRQNKKQTACPCYQSCICRIKMFIQLHLFFPNF